MVHGKNPSHLPITSIKVSSSSLSSSRSTSISRCFLCLRHLESNILSLPIPFSSYACPWATRTLAVYYMKVGSASCVVFENTKRLWNVIISTSMPPQLHHYLSLSSVCKFIDTHCSRRVIYTQSTRLAIGFFLNLVIWSQRHGSTKHTVYACPVSTSVAISACSHSVVLCCIHSNIYSKFSNIRAKIELQSKRCANRPSDALSQQSQIPIPWDFSDALSLLLLPWWRWRAE